MTFQPGDIVAFKQLRQSEFVNGEPGIEGFSYRVISVNESAGTMTVRDTYGFDEPTRGGSGVANYNLIDYEMSRFKKNSQTWKPKPDKKRTSSNKIHKHSKSRDQSSHTGYENLSPSDPGYSFHHNTPQGRAILSAMTDEFYMN